MASLMKMEFAKIARFTLISIAYNAQTDSHVSNAHPATSQTIGCVFLAKTGLAIIVRNATLAGAHNV